MEFKARPVPRDRDIQLRELPDMMSELEGGKGGHGKADVVREAA